MDLTKGNGGIVYFVTQYIPTPDLTFKGLL